MKIPNLLRRKKLTVAAARRSAAGPEIEYAEVPEPNMKLSRALLIVLLLHVVAVSGIIAFNVVKTRQGSLASADLVKADASPSETIQSTAVSGISSTRPTPVRRESGLRGDVETPKQSAKSVATEEHNSDHAKMGAHAKLPPSSGKFYTVLKGDNPVKIAKKLKVPYEDLMALNHIDDPKKLKVGQKLSIPKKSTRKQ